MKNIVFPNHLYLNKKRKYNILKHFDTVTTYICACVYAYIWASVMAQMIKTSPALQKIWL